MNNTWEKAVAEDRCALVASGVTCTSQWDKWRARWFIRSTRPKMEDEVTRCQNGECMELWWVFAEIDLLKDHFKQRNLSSVMHANKSSHFLHPLSLWTGLTYSCDHVIRTTKAEKMIGFCSAQWDVGKAGFYEANKKKTDSVRIRNCVDNSPSPTNMQTCIWFASLKTFQKLSNALPYFG